VISERSNFPTDLYIAESLCRERGFTLQLIDASELPAALTDEVAVLMLTHVNYRTGAMHDMKSVTAAAHAAGALTVWDLAHSAGAVPVSLNDSNADFAIGCGYKYLNGGPGAPAFVWVHTRHAGQFEQPLSGWWGHPRPPGSAGLSPGSGIARYLRRTNRSSRLAGLECGPTPCLLQGLSGRTGAWRRCAVLGLTVRSCSWARCAGRFKLVTPRAIADADRRCRSER
jgi:kynureninase